MVENFPEIKMQFFRLNYFEFWYGKFKMGILGSIPRCSTSRFLSIPLSLPCPPLSHPFSFLPAAVALPLCVLRLSPPPPPLLPELPALLSLPPRCPEKRMAGKPGDPVDGQPWPLAAGGPSTAPTCSTCRGVSLCEVCRLKGQWGPSPGDLAP